MSKYTWFVIVATLALLIAPSTALGVTKDPKLPKVHTSKNFKIHTEHSKIFAMQVGNVLEAFRKKFLRLFKSKKKLDVTKPLVFVYKTKAEYQAFCRANKPAFVNNEAFMDWRWGPDEAKIKEKWEWRIITWAHKKFADTAKYMVHELTHIFNNYYFDAPPLWLDEGLAVYFQTSRITRRGIVVGIYDKDFIKQYKQAIRNRKALTLKELFSLGADDDAKFTNLHYAQSWVLVHFLFHYKRGRLSKKFNKFFVESVKNGEYEKNFKKHFPFRHATLEAELKRYLFRMK